MEQHPFILPRGARIENYTVDRFLGAGGFGITYRCVDRTLNCFVALKEYFPSRWAVRKSNSLDVVPKNHSRPKAYEYGLERFVEEARMLAQFKNNNIVRVSRFIKANNTAYIVMDYEEGLSLQHFLKHCHKLTEKEIRLVSKPILKGLNEIHRRHYLHRDIKPSNIYLRKNGSPVLIDFGSARQAMNNLNSSTSRVVTAGYTPFEQYNKHDKQGPWTDIYSLGATLYQCISGQKPVDSLDRLAAINGDECDSLVPAAEIGKGSYSTELLNTIDKMLQVSFHDRPASTNELLTLFDIDNIELEDDYDSILSNKNIDWDPKVLEKIEHQLTSHMGPLSSMLVRQASQTSNNIDELIIMLKNSIDDPHEQTSFYNEFSHYTSGSISTSFTGSKSASSTELESVLNDDFINNTKENLAFYIGPIAHTLVNNAVNNATDYENLLEMLAAEIPGGNERDTFISKIDAQQTLNPNWNHQ